jgi:hypothetical protein
MTIQIKVDIHCVNLHEIVNGGYSYRR